MADLFLGQSMSEAYRFISAGTAHTFVFNFPPDKVTFYNLTKWTATAAGKPISVWFRDETTAAHAFQQQVIDSAASQSFNFLDTATNGFTDASTAGGAPEYRANISAISQADPCVITTSPAHGFQSDQIVRITDLGYIGPGVASHGMEQLNNNRYLITVLTSTTFSIRDVITDEPIDSTSFGAYVFGGKCDIESRTLTLNNPQTYPYSALNPYMPNQFRYDAPTNALLAGTAVMGSDGDRFIIEVVKYGQVTSLGDLVT